LQFATQQFGLDGYWLSSGSLQWFDGYIGQECAILDDYRPDHCRFSFILRVLDRYPFNVPIKGGFRRWKPDVIIVTTWGSPSSLYHKKHSEDVQQLVRRCTHILSSDSGLTTEHIQQLYNEYLVGISQLGDTSLSKVSMCNDKELRTDESMQLHQHTVQLSLGNCESTEEF